MADPVYTFNAPRRQFFSFPPDMIALMLKNPSSSKGLMKLYQTCKYFYGKRPILIADYVRISTRIVEGILLPTCRILDNGEDVSILKTQIWPSRAVYLSHLQYEFDVERISKLFRCSIQILFIYACHMAYSDFVRLTSENDIQWFAVNYIAYFHHSETLVATIDQILKCLPNVVHLDYFIDEMCSGDVLVKLNKLQFKHKFNVINLEIKDVHPTFDMNLFCEFIMKNSTPNTRMRFAYFRNTTRDKLKVIVEKMDSKWRTEAHEGLEELFRLKELS